VEQNATTVNGERIKLRTQRTNELVTAAVRENIFAGIGAGVIVFSGCVAWVAFTGAEFSGYHVVASGVTAGGTFGALSILRFSLDEFNDWREKLARENMIVDLVVERDTLRDRLVRAHATIKELRQQIAVLSTGGTSSKAVATPDELTLIADTCRSIVERWAANLPYSRDELRATMTDGEWGSAMALMERAGCIGRGGVSGKKKIIVGDSYDSVMRKVESRIKTERADAQNKFVRA
jgi:hypothetical protein